MQPPEIIPGRSAHPGRLFFFLLPHKFQGFRRLLCALDIDFRKFMVIWGYVRFGHPVKCFKTSVVLIFHVNGGFGRF